MTTLPVRWGPSAQGRALVALAVVSLGLALALRRAELLALATPALWTLLTSPRTEEPGTVVVRVPQRELRAEEQVPFQVALTVELGAEVAYVSAVLAVPSSLAGEVVASDTGARSLALEGELVPERWGRHRLGLVRVELLSTGGLRSARVDVPVAHDCLVLPRPAQVARASAPALLPHRLGEHVTRAWGHGVEPVAVRAFAAGDPIRRVNWRVSSRRQQLHVTVAADERAVDLVLVVDALSDVGPPPDSSLDRAVRVAAGMAGRWLRERDRVGLVVLGGTLRWLTPANGRVHLRRVAEAVLWAWNPPGEVPPDVDRVPRAVLPPGAVAVFLTPLLDQRALAALAGLRERSARLLVVDVLGDAAPEVDRKDEVGQLAARLWRLEREATVERLRRLGTPVLQPHEGELDRLVALALRAPR